MKDNNEANIEWVPVSGSPRYCKCGAVFYCHRIPERMVEYHQHIIECDNTYGGEKDKEFAREFLAGK